MYQALYRKWRPTTFSEIVGQEPITRTLQNQVATDRLSHAYLFTGTRGTGKTTCAKILSRGVNCTSPIDGNPCNTCPSCLGITDGSILDVLELDAASNSGVDHVRALRDEAHYSPASVKKRVYIIDEVHALSGAAFNALLKILEEPPEHLLFILATTELHKVPATIVSRCQQFAFKRILPQEISNRLSFVAKEEEIPLSQGGAALLARLADGGLRDALSLLDQCVGGELIDESHIYARLGLAGSLHTARLMTAVANAQSEEALTILATLYQEGGDVATILGELSTLARDLLLCHTAPNHAAALYSGGFDDGTLTTLAAAISPPQLLHQLTVIQETLAKLPHSTTRRTEGELCLMRLCLPILDESTAALSARIARLEQQITQPIVVAPPVVMPIPQPIAQVPPQPVSVSPSVAEVPPQPVPVSPTVAEVAPQPVCVPEPIHQPPDDSSWSDEPPPPWECAPPPPEDQEPDFDIPDQYDTAPVPPPRETPPPPTQAPPLAPMGGNPVPPLGTPQAPPLQPLAPPQAEPPLAGMQPSAATPMAQTASFWPAFSQNLKGKVSPIAIPYLCNPQKVTGRYTTGVLTLWVDSAFTKMALEKPSITTPLAKIATEFFAVESRVAVTVGNPPPLSPDESPSLPPQPISQPTPPSPPVSPAVPVSEVPKTVAEVPEIAEATNDLPPTEPTNEVDPLDDLGDFENLTIT
ncbi:MAG: DNA polymerase III subunit gamma/tau [Eubacteriales bacterium]